MASVALETSAQAVQGNVVVLPPGAGALAAGCKSDELLDDALPEVSSLGALITVSPVACPVSSSCSSLLGVLSGATSGMMSAAATITAVNITAQNERTADS